MRPKGERRWVRVPRKKMRGVRVPRVKRRRVRRRLGSRPKS